MLATDSSGDGCSGVVVTEPLEVDDVDAVAMWTSIVELFFCLLVLPMSSLMSYRSVTLYIHRWKMGTGEGRWIAAERGRHEEGREVNNQEKHTTKK